MSYKQEQHISCHVPTREELKNSFSVRGMVNTIIAASLSNMAGIASSHPLDTIKVRMQTSAKVSMKKCLADMVRKEGVRGLFKGIAQPIVASVPNNSSVFVTQHFAKTALKEYNPAMSDLQTEFISGSFGALVALSVVVPSDLMKVRAQTSSGKVNYSSLFKSISRDHGTMGLYRGFWATFWRDVPNWGVYFVTYEYLKNQGKSFANGQEDWSEQKKSAF
jgi:hypothetical protein